MALMLLADPLAGCTTVRRSLRPGGRLSATVFRDGGANPWLPAATLGAAPHVGALPPLPLGDEPGPFAFADPARVSRILSAAGFDAIDIRPHDVTMNAPDEPDAVAEWLIEMGPAGAAYRSTAPPGQGAARSAAARLLGRFRQPGAGYWLPAGIWQISAHVTQLSRRYVPDDGAATCRSQPGDPRRSSGQLLVHFWLVVPVQDHSWTFVPLAVPKLLASRHRPDCTPVMVPSALTFHCWLVLPVAVPDDHLGAVGGALPVGVQALVAVHLQLLARGQGPAAGWCRCRSPRAGAGCRWWCVAFGTSRHRPALTLRNTDVDPCRCRGPEEGAGA